MLNTIWEFLLLGLGLSPGYVFAAQGTVLVYRGSGVVNFAQGGFALIGAFTSLQLQNAGVSPMFALLGGVVAAAVVGGLTYGVVMRRLSAASQLVRIVATLGIYVIITQALALHYSDNTYYPATIVSQASIHIFGAPISKYDLVLFLFSIVLTAVLWAAYRYTKFGLQTSAVAENARSAAALGHPPERIGLINWTLGGAMGGLAGILIAPDIGLSVAEIGLLLVPALAAAVLGRFTSFWMTLLGGLIVAIGTSELTKYNLGTGWNEAFPFLVVIAILMFRSRSLLGRGETAAKLPQVGTGLVRMPLVVAGTVACAVLIAVLPISGQQAMTATLATAIIGLSLTVVTGYAGQLSLAQFGFAGASGWMAAKLSSSAGFTFWEAALVGVLVAIPIGLVVGLPALRSRG